MIFPWYKYKELPTNRKNTLQIFITNTCNRTCSGCFAKKIMKEAAFISLEEYLVAFEAGIRKGAEQVNILGGEPLLHPNLKEILQINKTKELKTTLYTNGDRINILDIKDIEDLKIRISVYCKSGSEKSVEALPETKIPIEVCFMVGKNTTVTELVTTADYIEKNYNCNVFFISSLRELDNPREEFFDDTRITMPVIQYKELVHRFLTLYNGNMEIHISKRGVFESTVTKAENTCRFANYFIGGKIIQCPYDIVNEKYSDDYSFNTRHCQQNNTCLMSKIIVQNKRKTNGLK